MTHKIENYAVPDNREGKTFFKRPVKNKVQNRILLGIMWVEGITTKQLAEEVDLSVKSIQRYIYEGHMPNDKNQDKIADILDCDKRTLFKEVR